MQMHAKDLKKNIQMLSLELKDIDAAIADFERLEAKSHAMAMASKPKYAGAKLSDVKRKRRRARLTGGLPRKAAARR